MVQLDIAVLTYLRNGEVAELLPQLAEEIARLPADVVPGLESRVTVVDNDPLGGARETVERLIAAHPVVRYLHEPTPGIAAARNRALDDAATDGLVLFIDDDERPTAPWLSAMLSTWAEHRPAAVGGPVVASLAEDIDPWIVEGGFFDRQFRSAFRTGQTVDLAPTGNLLLDMARVNAHGLRFDTTLGLAGGEDTLFTRQLVGAGERIVWCAEAEVLDKVPAERLTRRWLVRRVFMVSNASTHASLRLAGGARRRLAVRLRYLGTGGARMAIGAGRLIGGTLTRNRRARARGTSVMARGAGAASAAVGLRYEEYSR